MDDSANPYAPPAERVGTASTPYRPKRGRTVAKFAILGLLVAVLAIHAFLFVFILNDFPSLWE